MSHTSFLKGALLQACDASSTDRILGYAGRCCRCPAGGPEEHQVQQSRRGTPFCSTTSIMHNLSLGRTPCLLLQHLMLSTFDQCQMSRSSAFMCCFVWGSHSCAVLWSASVHVSCSIAQACTASACLSVAVVDSQVQKSVDE